MAITEVQPGGVQLWEDGPYWAECNVGAATPEEFGYYFWWGDTVGYRRENNVWLASDGSTSNFAFDQTAVPTSGKDHSALQSAGYIDSTGNLVATHDAATAHLGAPWRMPTSDELDELRTNCTTTWASRNGVFGRLVTGQDAYADKSIFLPAAGYGRGTSLNGLGTYGYYLSSTPVSSNSGRAWDLYFDSGSIYRNDDRRHDGLSVRPVRGWALCGAGGTVTCDPAPCTVEVTRFHQSYPFSGKATVEYTIGGTLPTDAVAQIVLSTDDASATFVQSNLVAGANSNVIDFASSFGGVLLLTNASFSVAITEVQPGGVQLWENGPYWAECNVGASTPEEFGYYFWWGDTVGYTRRGGTLGGNFLHPSIYYDVTWVSSTGEQMSNSPFATSCPTYDKEDAVLLSAGYIDSTTNLVAAHDAATAHLGAPWRMPTSDEMESLVSNCTTMWITNNGVSGRLVRGKGAYANRSIFLPATGFGSGTNLYDSGSQGHFWTSTPIPDFSPNAWELFCSSGYFEGRSSSRYRGQSVRPVRGFALCGADGTVTCDPAETQTTPVPVPYAWLDANVPGVAQEAGAYEAAANATATNGLPVWECYLTGVAAVSNELFTAGLEYGENGKLRVTWDPDLNEGGTKSDREYRVQGKKDLMDEEWSDVTDVEDLDEDGWSFFRVRVGMP